MHTERGDPSGPPLFIYVADLLLELGTGGYESLAGFVVLVLVEVLDEASGEILCLLVPY